MASSSLEKKTLSEGNKTDYPKKNDTVAMKYTGWLYDAAAEDKQFRGKQ
jgi:FKBP-type peptidyl-prolyl cis-trans isomerase